VGSLFASFLGYNPMASLLGPVLPTLSHAQQAYLTGRAFFPHLISGPFMDGLKAAFDFAIAACVLAAIASLLRGGRYIHDEMQAGEVTTVAASGPPATGAAVDREEATAVAHRSSA
jgi:hypothetical protein